MPIPVVCGCGASYTLKDEYQDQVVRCPQCGAALQVGRAAPPPAAVPARVASESVFARDKFLLRQQLLAISEKYDVCNEQGEPLLFVQRPRFVARNVAALLAGTAALLLWIPIFAVAASALPGARAVVTALGLLTAVPIMIGVIVALAPKRHVTFYRDTSKAEKVLEVFQDHKWQIPTATYTVRDSAGQVLARLSKNYLYDFFRKRWYCAAPNGQEICVVKEDSILLSMLRRVLGTFFGLLRTNFVFLRGDQVVGEFNRKFTILDRYVLDFSADPQHAVDRRIAVALGVMLDTGERR